MQRFIIISRPKNPSSAEEAQKLGFLEVAKRIDKNLAKPLIAEQKREYDALWGEDQHKGVKSLAEVLYRSGRHTMAHGFRAKGVYITAIEDVGVWRFKDGAIELNPFLFWREFVSAYNAAWEEQARETQANAPRTRSAKEYLKELLER